MTVKHFLRHNRFVYISILICLLLTYFVNINYVIHDKNILVVILLLGSFILPVWFLLIFIYRCFKSERNWKLYLSNILHTYIGTIIVFACVYYRTADIADYNDAINKLFDYKKQYLINNMNGTGSRLFEVKDQRAFRGIEKRLWTGIDYPPEMYTKSDSGYFKNFYTYNRDTYERLEANSAYRIGLQTEFSEELIQPLAGNRMAVFFDCLYYSTITIATVGFGDISPVSMFAKFVTAVEVLTGVVIMVFAIGFFFSSSGFSVNKKNASDAG